MDVSVCAYSMAPYNPMNIRFTAFDKRIAFLPIADSENIISDTTEKGISNSNMLDTFCNPDGGIVKKILFLIGFRIYRMNVSVLSDSIYPKFNVFA